MSAKVIETQYGGKKPNPVLMSPEPNTTYRVSPNPVQVNAGIRFVHEFKTDTSGFVEFAWIKGVQFFEPPLAGVRHRRKPPGKPPGSYDRGHIISAELGAGMEFINLLWMPDAVNQRLTPETARRAGHTEIALQMERYLDPESPSGGTLSGTGEFNLPNYRIFEERVKSLSKVGATKGFEVSVLIKPSTYHHDGTPLTDIFYTEIFAGDKALFKYKIESDISEHR